MKQVLFFIVFSIQASFLYAQSGVIQWTNVRSLTITGDVLYKYPNSQTAWNSGAISQQGFYGDGWVEFRFNENKYALIGLAAYNNSTAPSSTNYAMYSHLNRRIYIWENGVELSNIGMYKAIEILYTANDIFRVERQNGIIYYKKNGVIFYTSQVPAAGALHADASFLLYQAKVTFTDFMYGAVWTGDVDQSWNNPANWKRNHIPLPNDQVIVNACVPCPRLSNPTDITALILRNGSALTLDSNVLSAKEAIQVDNAVVSSVGGQVQAKDFLDLKNSMFRGSIVLKKTGGDSDTCYGGNIFSTEVKIENASGTSWEVAAHADNKIQQL